MDFKEYRAKTVNDAITDALIELGTTSDMIEYEVIEEGSAGLLGLFSKDAIVRVRRKEEEVVEFNFKEEFLSSINLNPEEKKPEEKKPAKKEKAPEKKPEKKQEPKAKAEKPVKEAAPAAKESEPKAKAEKPEKKAPAAAEKASNAAPYQADHTAVNDILRVLFDKLGIQAEVSISVDESERVVNITVEGDDTGDLIGKRGQTLDAIQYLLSLVINKEQDAYYRVKLDTNNYRERRQKTLENLAKNMAGKVKKTHRRVALEPMNPYERRVIHAYLQPDKFVTTKSEGEEPNRRVVIYYKKQ